MSNASIANQIIPECESTNDLARVLGESGYPNGTWIAARRQTQGRGRRSREWVSLEGNLFVSWVIRPKNPVQQWSWLPLAAGVAVCQTLDRFKPKLQVKLKWPNDLWLEGKKVGGFLCEMQMGPGAPYVVVGLGLNCRHAPAGLDQETAALDLDSKTVLSELNSSVPRDLEQVDPALVSAAFLSRSALPVGTAIEWSSGAGTVHGLGTSGELLVETLDRGEEKTIRLVAEDVRELRGVRSKDG